jgi:hypothetical protein
MPILRITWQQPTILISGNPNFNLSVQGTLQNQDNTSVLMSSQDIHWKVETNNKVLFTQGGDQ